MNGFRLGFFIYAAVMLSNMPALVDNGGVDGPTWSGHLRGGSLSLPGEDNTRHVYVRARRIEAGETMTSRADTSTHKFPVKPESLDGKRVLLIVIPRNTLQTAYFVAGIASWTGDELQVRSSSEAAPVVAKGARVTLQGFDPALLPRLIIPRYYHQVADVAKGAVACVVIFAPTAPVGALALRAPFFGLASGKDDTVVLMQGDPGI